MHLITAGKNNQCINSVIKKLKIIYTHEKLVTAPEVSCLYCVPHRTWGNVSGIDSDSIEARIQPGYSLLCYDLLEKLVQRSVFN